MRFTQLSKFCLRGGLQFFYCDFFPKTSIIRKSDMSTNSLMNKQRILIHMMYDVIIRVNKILQVSKRIFNPFLKNHFKLYYIVFWSFISNSFQRIWKLYLSSVDHEVFVYAVERKKKNQPIHQICIIFEINKISINREERFNYPIQLIDSMHATSIFHKN